MSTKPRRPNKGMTDEQRRVRLDNLARGRKKRAEMVKQKKEQKPEEYDISSNDGSLDESDSSSDSDNDAFVISKAKKKQPKPVKEKEKVLRSSRKSTERAHSKNNENLKGEVDELKTMIIELANMQKKQNKSVRKSRPSGGTKIVVLPQNTSGGSQTKGADDYMEKLRKSIFD